MGAKTTVAAGAVAAVQDPLHPEGVIYTMPDASRLRVYDDGGKRLAYRLQNPGIAVYDGPGVIGRIPRVLADGKTYQYPVFGSAEAAAAAVLSKLDGYDQSAHGAMTVATVMGGVHRYNGSKTYFQDNIQGMLPPGLTDRNGEPITAQTPWSDVPDKARTVVSHAIVQFEGVFNSAGTKVEPLPPQSPSSVQSSGTNGKTDPPGGGEAAVPFPRPKPPVPPAAAQKAEATISPDPVSAALSQSATLPLATPVDPHDPFPPPPASSYLDAKGEPNLEMINSPEDIEAMLDAMVAHEAASAAA